MKQALAAEDFVTDESLESGGIPDVFPTFQTARVGQKIRCPAEAELFRGSSGLAQKIMPLIFGG